MARRSLLTGEERRRLFEPPTSDREIATRYTLSPDDLDWIDERRRPANKLGAAMQLALLRHPGFGWATSTPVPATLLNFIAEQIHVPPTALATYGGRGQTRSAHLTALHARLGLRAFGRSDLKLAPRGRCGARRWERCGERRSAGAVVRRRRRGRVALGDALAGRGGGGFHGVLVYGRSAVVTKTSRDEAGWWQLRTIY